MTQALPTRRFVLALATAAAVAPRWASAQTTPPVVGALIGAPSATDPSGIEWENAIEIGLRGQGWRVGDNVRLEARFTAGDRNLIEASASELVSLEPALIIAGTTLNAQAVRRLTATIPVVFAAVTDPVGMGLVPQIARPGGTTTGISHFEPAQAGKFVELLLEIAPATRIVVSFTNPAGSTAPAAMRPYIAQAAAIHGLGFQEVFVSAVDEIGPAIDTIAAMAGAGLVIPANNWVQSNVEYVLRAIDRHRLPAVFPAVRMVEVGGLVGLGIDTTRSFEMAGDYAGQILNGTEAGWLPVLSPKYVLIVNLKTARMHGIVVPPSILVAADRIVE